MFTISADALARISEVAGQPREVDEVTYACIMDITLTICIATYNRAGFIRHTLDTIIPQLEDGVELLVVDGASPDNTAEVVLTLAGSCPRLRYVRLDEKGGVDQDYDRAVELAHGRYCWLFTDDDVLKPGAVKAVLEAIARGYSVVVANAEVRDCDLSTELIERRMPFFVNREYADDPNGREQFFRDVTSYLSYIGGLIIQRTLWLSRDRARYHGSSFAHVGVLFGSPMTGRCYVLADTWITIRLGNAEWAGRRFEIWLLRWPSLVWSFNGYSDSSKEAICRRYPWKRIRSLVFCRALGVYDTEKYEACLRPLVAAGGRKAGLALTARMPMMLARAIVRSYCVLFRDATTLYVLSSSPRPVGKNG